MLQPAAVEIARKNGGGGKLYKENIALWTPYLYAKPLRRFYSGDKNLLIATATGVGKNGTMDVVKALSAAGPDGKRYLCLLNRGLGVEVGGLWIDGKRVSGETVVRMESVSGAELAARR